MPMISILVMKRLLALLVTFTVLSLLAKNTDKKGPSNSVHKRTKNNNQKLKSEETNTNANPNATNKYFRLRLNIIFCGIYQN